MKGFLVYWRKSNVDEKVNRVLSKRKRHSNTAIKVVWDANEGIGDMFERLSKVIAPVLKSEIVLTIEVEVFGHPRDAREGK